MNLYDIISDFGIVDLTVSTALGFGMQQFISSFTRDIITPLLENYLPIHDIINYSIKLKKTKTPLRVGDFFLAFINLATLVGAILLMLFSVFPFLQKVIKRKKEHPDTIQKQNDKIIQQLDSLNHKYSKSLDRVYGNSEGNQYLHL